jgi:hypothetical protein
MVIDAAEHIGEPRLGINDHRMADLTALLPWRWAAERERRRLVA